MPKPTIAAINGFATGLGLDLALACDLRVAAEDAVLGLPAVRECLIPGLGTYRLPRLIGMGRARELLLLGESIDARRALEGPVPDRLVRTSEGSPYVVRFSPYRNEEGRSEGVILTFLESPVSPAG